MSKSSGFSVADLQQASKKLNTAESVDSKADQKPIISRVDDEALQRLEDLYIQFDGDLDSMYVVFQLYVRQIRLNGLLLLTMLIVSLFLVIPFYFLHPCTIECFVSARNIDHGSCLTQLMADDYIIIVYYRTAL